MARGPPLPARGRRRPWLNGSRAQWFSCDRFFGCKVGPPGNGNGGGRGPTRQDAQWRDAATLGEEVLEFLRPMRGSVARQNLFPGGRADPGGGGARRVAQ